MSRYLKSLFLAVVASFLCTAAIGAERGTPDEAKSMLSKAVAHLKAGPAEKALADFSDRQSRFADRDLYVTAYDMSGKCIAHGANPRSIGKDNINLQDADGKFLIKERLEIAKAKGRGTQDYKFLNPQSKAVELKTMHFEKVGDIVLGVGFYKP